MREEEKRANGARETIRNLFHTENWLIGVGTIKLLSDRYIVRVMVNKITNDIQKIMPVKVNDVPIVVDEVNDDRNS